MRDVMDEYQGLLPLKVCQRCGVHARQAGGTCRRCGSDDLYDFRLGVNPTRQLAQEAATRRQQAEQRQAEERRRDACEAEQRQAEQRRHAVCEAERRIAEHQRRVVLAAEQRIAAQQRDRLARQRRRAVAADRRAARSHQARQVCYLAGLGFAQGLPRGFWSGSPVDRHPGYRGGGVSQRTGTLTPLQRQFYGDTPHETG